MAMQKSKFSLDVFGEETFEGFTNGEGWNGFARPYFERDEAQKIVEASNKSGLKANYNTETDTFSFAVTNDDTQSSNTTEETADIFGPVEVDGQLLYPIGAGSWTWWDEAWDEN